MKHIVAIGGGGFGSAKPGLKIEKYLLSLTGKAKPKICFLPQASREDQDYIVKFYGTFCALGAEPSWISLFGRVEDSWKEKLLDQDIIYVGGGNTKSMIALWKAWGLDEILRAASEKETVLAGVSAGAICWFEEGITDSVWPLGVVKALGFLSGSFCPHFDSESERQDVYRTKVKNGEVQPGLALEDETAVHFVNGKLKCALKWNVDKKVLSIQNGKEELIETVLLD